MGTADSARIEFCHFSGALASFEFLMRQVIRVLRRENERSGADSASPLPTWIWQLLGYSLFAWSTLGMMWAPRMITPDLCVATFVYLDCGLLLSLRSSIKSLGLVSAWAYLGFGYLAKLSYSLWPLLLWPSHSLRLANGGRLSVLLP